MKNREFETITECVLPDGKVRVWMTQASLEAAVAMDQSNMGWRLQEIIAPHWPDFAAVAVAIEKAAPHASAIAITDAAGNGVTLYPDWK